MRTRVGSAALFCVMAAIFLVELATGAVRNDARLLRLGALPDSGEIGHEYWRLVTFGFSHWDLTHLLLNSVLLLTLGPIVERRAGTAWLRSCSSLHQWLAAPVFSLNISSGHRKASRLAHPADYSAFSGSRSCSPSGFPHKLNSLGCA